MKKQNDKITADRLIEASEAVLKAVREAAEMSGSPLVSPPDLMGSPDQPECLCDYTRFEVEEATAFLIRLGYLERVRPSGA